MAIISCKNLTFTYSTSQKPVLRNVNLDLEQGKFYLICGKSGSGKSTLLRHMKKQLVPKGEILGEVLYNGTNVKELEEKISASEVGFVMQDIDGQIVTDKVWSELAFGLGNLGYDDKYIANRLAEVSEYFGISKWFNKRTAELSGGGKQIVSLASIIATNPKLLLLDEPTSMLDPIARKNFANLLARINKELGITIVAVEHNMQEMFDLADEIIVLDEGEIKTKKPPYELPAVLSNAEYAKYVGLPEQAEIFVSLCGTGNFPKNVFEGARWLKENFANTINDAEQLNKIQQSDNEKQNECAQKQDGKEGINANKASKIDTKQSVLSVKGGYFRYDKKGEDILKGVDFSLFKGEVVCIVGGNGSGKSTFISALVGANKLYSGKVIVKEKEKGKKFKVSAIFQNPKSLFVEQSVREELLTMAKFLGVEKQKVEQLICDFELGGILDNHPYDISGGEVQKLAIAKALLVEPDIIVLDEPTQGVDKSVKEYLKTQLAKFKAEGKSVIIVTHDLTFASEIADRVGMFFDGKIFSLSNANDFFACNNFYTTTSALLTRGYYKNAYTAQRVIELGVANGKCKI